MFSFYLSEATMECKDPGALVCTAEYVKKKKKKKKASKIKIDLQLK